MMEEIAAELRQAHQATAPIVPVKAVMSEVQCRLAEWQKVLAEETKQARQMLRMLLRGRLVFTPDLERHACEFVGEGDRSEVFRGLVPLPTALASPMPASWNQIVPWLQQIDGLRRPA